MTRIASRPTAVRPVAAPAPAPASAKATRSWLEGSGSFTFKSQDPSAPSADVRPFADLLARSRLVALGEGGHGMREYTALRHRLFKEMVQRHGFTELLFEVEPTQAILIDNYLQRGETGVPGVDLDSVMAQSSLTHGQEMRELIEWARGHNQTHPKKIRFRGIDCQNPAPTAAHVRQYLRQVDPAYADQVSARLERLGRTSYDFPALDRKNFKFGTVEEVEAELATRKQALEDGRALAAQLRRRFSANEKAYRGRSSTEAFSDAHHAIRVLEQALELAINFRAVKRPAKQHMPGQTVEESDRALRDRLMAQNTRTLLERRAGSRGVVWGENGHIDKTRDDSPLGYLLSKHYGRDYMSVGFIPGSGTFMGQPLEPFAAGSVDQMFVDAARGREQYAVDFRAKKPREVDAWLRQKRPFRGNLFGGVEGDRTVAPGDVFDAVVYVASVRPATPSRTSARRDRP